MSSSFKVFFCRLVVASLAQCLLPSSLGHDLQRWQSFGLYLDIPQVTANLGNDVLLSKRAAYREKVAILSTVAIGQPSFGPCTPWGIGKNSIDTARLWTRSNLFYLSSMKRVLQMNPRYLSTARHWKLTDSHRWAREFRPWKSCDQMFCRRTTELHVPSSRK
jgi:hypothetical protein